MKPFLFLLCVCVCDFKTPDKIHGVKFPQKLFMSRFIGETKLNYSQNVSTRSLANIHDT